MSYKGQDIEDKAETVLPRSIPALRSLLNEVRQALTQNRTGALEGLLAELEQMRRRVTAEQIEASRVGAPSAHHVAYADLLNQVNEVRAQGFVRLNGLGTVRAG